jgi:hypothetical protein
VHQGESTCTDRRRADGLLQTFRSRWLYLQLSQHLASRERADRLVDRFLHEAQVEA